MHPTLFTLGYEGLAIEAFITRLQTAQMKTVVNLRELPLSRKKGFGPTVTHLTAKTALPDLGFQQAA